MQTLSAIEVVTVTPLKSQCKIVKNDKDRS